MAAANATQPPTRSRICCMNVEMKHINRMPPPMKCYSLSIFALIQFQKIEKINERTIQWLRKCDDGKQRSSCRSDDSGSSIIRTINVNSSRSTTAMTSEKVIMTRHEGRDGGSLNFHVKVIRCKGKMSI